MKGIAVAIVTGSLLMLTIGCGGKQKTAALQKAAKNKGGGAHHGHDHSAKGPHDGHIIELGNEEYHAEWLHNNKTGLITFYLLGPEMTKDVKSEAKHLLITTKIKGKKPREYKIPAVNPEGTPPVANKYELTDKVLLEALRFAGAEGFEVKLKLSIKGKEFNADVKHDH